MPDSAGTSTPPPAMLVDPALPRATCPYCSGTGKKHLDRGGYLNQGYDIPCPNCGGRGFYEAVLGTPMRAAYAYHPRIRHVSTGANHAIVLTPFQLDRIKRNPGDALCAPARRFYNLDARPGREPTCARCLRILERARAKPQPPATSLPPVRASPPRALDPEPPQSPRPSAPGTHMAIFQRLAEEECEAP